MIRILLVLLSSLWVGAASAQTPSAATQAAAAAGLAGGRAVGASTAFDATSGQDAAWRAERGHDVIGHVVTTGMIPGNTGGASTGAK